MKFFLRIAEKAINKHVASLPSMESLVAFHFAKLTPAIGLVIKSIFLK